MRLSRYNFVLYSGEYGYWYNALTGSFFRLSSELSKKVENLLPDLSILEVEAKPLYDKLCDAGFIVSHSIDELDIIRQNHSNAVHSKEYFLIILPTLNCNFKCWYCIQEHLPSIMNVETFESIKKHIDYMVEEECITSLHLDWFGGEPFMTFKKVVEPLSRYAIEKCNQYNIPFINTSTTNGYFINKDVADALEDLKFTQFQITIDGEKKFHDNVKFMNGCDSAFEQVLTNINYILERNATIKVFLRINYTHKTLSKRVVSEVNNFISLENRSRVVVTPKKVWQENVDKNFGEVLHEILNDFEVSGYLVSRREITTTFTSCLLLVLFCTHFG